VRSESTRPPKAARWLLEYFGWGRNNAALVGDLDERYRQGRSRSWYWRQVLVAVTSQRLNRVRRISVHYVEKQEGASSPAGLVKRFDDF